MGGPCPAAAPCDGAPQLCRLDQPVYGARRAAALLVLSPLRMAAWLRVPRPRRRVTVTGGLLCLPAIVAGLCIAVRAEASGAGIAIA